MLVLGINSSFEELDEELHPGLKQPGLDYCHDSSSVLLDGTQIVVALETERLDRIKHSPKLALPATLQCLRQAGVRVSDLAAVAWNGIERLEWMPRWREYLSKTFERHFGERLPEDRFVRVNHHAAHAASAWGYSGFDEQLVVTMDWSGCGASGVVGVARGSAFEALHVYSYPDESLGVFYATSIDLIGYGTGEEYKAMGLAPYGDPERYREFFETTFALFPDGTYRVDPDAIHRLASKLPVRKRGELFTQEHKDIAAAIQTSFERMAFHTLTSWAQRTSMKSVSLAGGCAQNSSFNGRLLRSGLFERVFVQPAAYDAGCALGAAHVAAVELGAKLGPRMRSARFGTSLPEGDTLYQALERWSGLATITRFPDIATEAAQRLKDGQVLGWAEGRSEFGARALGGRSIVADPRPAMNKDRINAMIKMREGYRPFAPSVQAEHAREYFELTGDEDIFQFMTFVVPVREKYRDLLGAVTHVDGTARVQTVERSTSPRYWDLLEAFRRATGLPIVLNTSFNNNREPIVDTIEDALECYFTTGLDALVLGDCLIERRGPSVESLPMLVARVPGHVQVDVLGGRLWSTGWRIWSGHHERAVSSGLLALLERARADGARLDDFLAGARQRAELEAEVLALWSERWIRLHPPSS